MLTEARLSVSTLRLAFLNIKKAVLPLTIASITLLFIFVNNSYAQESQKNLIYSWGPFDKGLDSKSAPIGLSKGFGTICQNVDLGAEHGSITKRDEIFSYGTMSATEETTSIYRLYLKDGTTKVLIGTHDDEIEVGADSTGVFTSKLTVATADYRWKWVTWHNLAIGCDGYNKPVKTDGTNFTYLGSLFCKLDTSGTGPAADGTRSYKVSFYTTSYEVIFNVISNTVTADGNDILLSMIPIGPDTYLGEDVTGRKIYRNKGAAQTTWYLLSNGTIANNTATTLTDSDTDAELSATEYPSGDATWTPPKGKFVVVHKNRLWFANDPTTATDTGPSTANYSKDGSHDLFAHTTDYLNVRKNDGDEITGIFNLLGILTISKTNTWQKIYTDGDDPAADWEISDPFSFVGCVAPYSATNTPLGIFYLTWGGLYNFNGQHSKLLSDAITPTIDDISISNFKNASGEYNENIFYLAYASKESSKNDRLLKYNLLTNAITIDLLDINCFTVLRGQDDWGDLYAGSSTDGEVYTYTKGSTLTVSHSTFKDFTGTWDDMGYFQVIEGGDPQGAVLDLRENANLDDIPGTIDAGTGDVDRPDTGGTYASIVMHMPGITAYNTLEWHETIPSGNDVYFQYKGGTTEAACIAASFDATQYTTPSGSDISGETAYEYTQYQITMSTDDIDESPTVFYAYNFTVKITYDILASDMETSIPLEWETGWTSLDAPVGYKKILRKVFAWIEGTSGILTLTFTTDENITDTFEIDLTTNTSYYEEYFTGGGLLGQQFKLNIQNDDMYPLKIKNISVMYDIEPIY